MAVGDFNILFSVLDKNGPSINVAEIIRFRDVINEAGLSDLPLRNRSFTWSNGRRSPTLERLDRAFISNGWTTVFPSSSLRALPRPRSDHCPLLITACSFIPSARLFRFESWWLRLPALSEVVSDAWAQHAPASDPASHFTAKLDNVQSALKTWSAGFAATTKSQRDYCLFWIDWLDRAEERRLLTGSERRLRPTLKVRYEELCLREEIKWRQRSRVQWLKSGDSNTAFFHRRANGRRCTNRITAISDGSTTMSTHDAIADHLFTFFANRLGADCPPCCSIDFRHLYGPTAANLSVLDLPFSLEEVKSAVFSSAPEKAPGPDGFPLLFYQRFWGLLKEDILGVFNELFSGNADFSAANSSWICPIPKKPVISSARDLRPISLVHSLSKILSKVLASRLQGCLQLLVNPHQAAFVKGRSILDNFFGAHFLVHHLSSSKAKAAVLKIDFERAFDHVSWPFLFELLAARGFGQRWIGWVKLLLRSASSAVLLNGIPGNSFSCERGLRQGDPLSPLLFILCVDVLYKMLQAAVNVELLSPARVGELRFHTLQYADDLLLFFDGSLRSAAAIKLILASYSSCSGLKINFDKSAIIPINLPPEQLRKPDYLPLIEKVDKRLANWKGLSLSRGGRLVLLNSVLSGIPAYFCSAFRLPAWVIAAIDKIRRGFFWRGKILNNGFHCLVKWGSVCRPKRSGGLGVKNLHAANSALLMKGLWSFFSKTDIPWVQMIRHKHHRSRPPSLLCRLPAGCSPIWKDMLRLAPPFFASVDFVVGSGEASPFWTARWHGDSALSNRFPNLFVAAKSKHLAVRGWIQKYSGNWESGFTLPLNSMEHEELHLLRPMICNWSGNGHDDSLWWRWSNSGQFTTKKAYQFLAFTGSTDCKIPFLWKLKVPLRVKVFLWIAARNRLLTADNLARRGWAGPTICVFCSRSAEDLGHLLFGCTFATALWARILSRHSVLFTMGTTESLWKELPTTWSALRSSFSGFALDTFDTCFAAVCWALWKERNARLFTNRLSTVEELENTVLGETNFWIANLRDHNCVGAPAN